MFLPSFIWEGDGRERVRGLLDFAREVERLGFNSIFITDHVVAAKHFYDVSWLDSLTALTFVAAVTERVRLGTSILILPLRNPVILAKQMATLEYLSRGSLHHRRRRGMVRARVRGGRHRTRASADGAATRSWTCCAAC